MLLTQTECCFGVDIDNIRTEPKYRLGALLYIIVILATLFAQCLFLLNYPEIIKLTINLALSLYLE